jgi:hypothetical protein
MAAILAWCARGVVVFAVLLHCGGGVSTGRGLHGDRAGVLVRQRMRCAFWGEGHRHQYSQKAA